MRSVIFLGSALRSCLTMGVVSHLVRFGVLSGLVCELLFWSIYKSIIIRDPYLTGKAALLLLCLNMPMQYHRWSFLRALLVSLFGFGWFSSSRYASPPYYSRYSPKSLLIIFVNSKSLPGSRKTSVLKPASSPATIAVPAAMPM